MSTTSTTKRVLRKKPRKEEIETRVAKSDTDGPRMRDNPLSGSVAGGRADRDLRSGHTGSARRTKGTGPTPAQILLKKHLAELGIETVYEFRFCMERAFRFDLYCERLRIGFECDGGQFSGGHMRGYAIDNQYEKDRLAQIYGYRIFRFTNRQVLRGSAFWWLRKYLIE